MKLMQPIQTGLFPRLICATANGTLGKCHRL